MPKPLNRTKCTHAFRRPARLVGCSDLQPRPKLSPILYSTSHDSTRYPRLSGRTRNCSALTQQQQQKACPWRTFVSIPQPRRGALLFSAWSSIDGCCVTWARLALLSKLRRRSQPYLRFHFKIRLTPRLADCSFREAGSFSVSSSPSACAGWCRCRVQGRNASIGILEQEQRASFQTD